MGTDRFPREIHIIAQLQHPHIVPRYDSGEAGGFLYYVMPFIEGESLRVRLARVGRLPINEAVRLLQEIAEALAYAHGRGLVHRDIKPDNVMLSGRHAAVTDDDRNVHFHQTVDLARRLEKQGVRYEELVLPDEIHGFLRHASWLTSERAMVAWFHRELPTSRP